MSIAKSAGSLALVLVTAACGRGDTMGVHLELAADGGAEITTRSLSPASAPGPVEAETTGVAWQQRARLECSRGRVASLAELRIDEIRFDVREGAVRVSVPCGPDADWLELFVPGPEERDGAVEIYDPKRETPNLASRVVFELVVPGRVVAAGASPSFGARSEHERSLAWLEVSVDSVRRRERTLVWDVTWR